MKIVKKEEKIQLQKANIDQENQYKQNVQIQDAGKAKTEDRGLPKNLY